VGGLSYQIGSHAMNGGSGGKAVVSMEDANNEMWDRLFALLDMDPFQGCKTICDRVDFVL